MKPEQPLSAKQELTIVALLGGAGVDAAAERAGVKPVTLWRWQQEPTFQTAYKEARRKVAETALDGLQQVAGQAVQTLRDIMANPDASYAVRASCAAKIIDYTLRGIELQTLEERLEALERAVAARKRGTSNVNRRAY